MVWTFVLMKFICETFNILYFHDTIWFDTDAAIYFCMFISQIITYIWNVQCNKLRAPSVASMRGGFLSFQIPKSLLSTKDSRNWFVLRNFLDCWCKGLTGYKVKGIVFNGPTSLPFLTRHTEFEEKQIWNPKWYRRHGLILVFQFFDFTIKTFSGTSNFLRKIFTDAIGSSEIKSLAPDDFSLLEITKKMLRLAEDLWP